VLKASQRSMTVRIILMSLSVVDPGTKVMVSLAADNHWIDRIQEGMVLSLLVI